MMSDLARQLEQDRLLRDAARALVVADLAHVKGEVAGDANRPDLKTRARDLADDTRDFAETHKVGLGAVVALLVAGVIAWIFREPLAALVREALAPDAEHEGPEQGVDDERSQEEPEISAEIPA